MIRAESGFELAFLAGELSSDSHHPHKKRGGSRGLGGGDSVVRGLTHKHEDLSSHSQSVHTSQGQQRVSGDWPTGWTGRSLKPTDQPV